MNVPEYLCPRIYIQLENPNNIPFRANPSDAGADLCAKEDTYLLKNTRTLVKTGVRIEIPVGYVGLLVPRSSLSKHNIIMTNSVGVIDASYRGEIMASLMYIGELPEYTIYKDERIVQLLIMPIILPGFIPISKLSETPRGAGGFGSTGK